jgi:broad specificity phosphatase PhoE
MEVLFIRHGETDGNVAWRHQHENTRLSEVGKLQVARALSRVTDFAPTHLITSTNLRAVETARAIAIATGLIPDTNALFEELRRPAYMTGHRFISLTTVWYILTWFYGRQYRDGESYDMFVSRLTAARQYLESLPANARIIVVSHSVFINLFVAHRCRSGPLWLPVAVWQFLLIMLYKNTGVRHLCYTPASINTTPQPACGWKYCRR